MSFTQMMLRLPVKSGHAVWPPAMSTLPNIVLVTRMETGGGCSVVLYRCETTLTRLSNGKAFSIYLVSTKANHLLTFILGSEVASTSMSLSRPEKLRNRCGNNCCVSSNTQRSRYGL